MEEAVVGAVVGASIQVLLQNLLNISQEQINLFWYFKNDLETLKKSFFLVKDFLHDAETRQVTDNAVKRWLRDLEALAFDADNVLDDINYQLLSNKVETTENKTTFEKVLSFVSNNPIAYDLTLGPRIKDIIETLESINQRATDFGLQTRIAIAQVPASGSNASGSTETDSFTVDPIFYGRGDDIKRIVGMLITAPILAEQVLSVLPIVGMGGLGKTTLARKVFNDEEIKTCFNTRVWVHVPRIFDVLVLLKNILTSLTTENAEHGNREAILKKLQTHLGAKKYLLVLDDVWNEDKEKWDDFVKSFSGINPATGNCMIVTTRSEVVASIVETLPVHNLKGLSDDDCWSIIEAKAFRGGDSPLEFETIRRNIANRCKGLPLAAKVFGGLLFGKSKNEWLGIEKKPLSNFGDGDHVYKILKLSFDNLSPPSLKKCFAFCSIFPKGYAIEKEKLIELWMAEGFLQTDRRNNINMETAGSDFFNILLHNSLLQVARRDEYYGNVTHCNMHDLVHDLAYFVLHGNDNVTDGVCQSRYIGWKPSGDGLLSIPEGQERYVRTLFFGGRISDIEFSDFESLHSLTLRGDHITELPTSIRELKHLRYLDITETRIEYLPDWVGELYHLQTLRAANTSCYLKRLPDSLCYLINLRHLHILKDTKLPLEIGKLTSLHTLPYFHVGSEKGRGISELRNMKKLKGKLEIDNLEKVHDKKEAMSADLLGKPGIYELRLVWAESREVDEANDDKSVLEGLQPHPNLKGLGISGYKGKSLPQWTSKMAVQLDGRSRWEGLDSLMEIRLEKCNEVEELPMLGHLPHLESLYLENLEKVRYIGPSFYNIKDCCKSRTSNNGVVVVVFGALERLELLKMPNLIEWTEVDFPSVNELEVFPRLDYLSINECRQLVRAPSHFPRLKELYINDVESVLPVKNICGMKSTSLIHLKINGVDGLLCLPDEIFSKNNNLKELTLSGCPNMTCLVPCLRGGGASLKELTLSVCPKLRELPSDLHSLNALEILCINECPELKSIPYPPPSRGGSKQHGFTSLRYLSILGCGGLTNLPIEMVESCALSLQLLELDCLSSITNLGMVIECVNKIPNLRGLVILDVPKFSIKLLDNTTGILNKLTILGIGPSPSWDDNFSYNETVDAMLPQFNSLRRLTLQGMEHWECLPDQIQHLNALEDLWLYDFGIEALPEWFGNLSLEILGLQNFQKLRYFPSKQAMQRLSKLRFLDIRNCPLLLKEERSDNSNNEGPQIVDPEWPKISYIATIYVDSVAINRPNVIEQSY